MLGKVALLLYSAVIIAAGVIHNDFQSERPHTSFPSGRLHISNVQHDIPLEAKILQSQNMPPAISQEGVAQHTEKSDGNGYFANRDSRFIIRPAVVKITAPSVAKPIQNPKLIQYGVRFHPAITQSLAARHQFTPASEIINREQVTAVAPEKLRIDAQKSVTVHTKNTNYVSLRQIPQSNPKSAVQDISVPIAVATPGRPQIQYAQVNPSLSNPIPVSVLATYPIAASVPGIPRVQYSQANAGLSEPIAVPVIYDTEEVVKPQYVALIKLAQPSPRVRAQPIYSKSQAPLRYIKLSNVVYTNPTELPSAAPRTHSFPSQNGYARAVAYSPATEVSSVKFTGSEASYGW